MRTFNGTGASLRAVGLHRRTKVESRNEKVESNERVEIKKRPNEETWFADEGLRGLWSSVCLAQKVGARLGGSQVLQR